MGHDDRREIFERLAALERLVRSQHGERGGAEEHRRGGRERDRWEHRGRDRDRNGHDDDFQEKRIIDTIVHLVCENMGRMMQDQEAHARQQQDGGGEKRIVDLIVSLVSEHVREIVVTELDRRLGRGDGGRDEHSAADTPRGGAPDSEEG
jgi:hypothetical protein